MATTLEVIRGLSQAAANVYDGVHDEKYSLDGEARKIGLYREEGDVITDSRVMDGFKIRFHGDKLIINYQYDCKLKHIHENGFENEISQRLADIAKYLRSEYKKITGNGLTLTKDGDTDIMVEYTPSIRRMPTHGSVAMSRVNSWASASLNTLTPILITFRCTSIALRFKPPTSCAMTSIRREMHH